MSRRKLAEPAQLPPTETGLSASSAQSGLSTNLTVRRGTNSTSTRQSDAERKLYEQYGKSAEQFSRGSRHPSATAGLFGSSLVKALGTPTLREGATPHTEPCEFSERFVLTAIRINTPRMSQPFMVARSCTTSRHVSSAWGTHLRSRLHAARTVHVPSAQGVHCENCATSNASPSPRRVRGTRQQ